MKRYDLIINMDTRQFVGLEELPDGAMVYWIDANRRIAALEAENALLRVAAGPLVVAALETKDDQSK
jgi:hypothetical protein